MATPTYTPLATQTLGSAAASITFSSIPGTYTDLRLVLTCTTSAAGGDGVALQFNADTATNYSHTRLVGTGSSASSANATSATSIRFANQGGTSTTVTTMYTIDVQSYAGSTNKAMLATASTDTNGAGTVELTIGLWRSTAAITSIVLLTIGGDNFATGTIATLFGI